MDSLKTQIAIALALGCCLVAGVSCSSTGKTNREIQEEVIDLTSAGNADDLPVDVAGRRADYYDRQSGFSQERTNTW